MMALVGTIGSLWRYPIKSMGGEEMPKVFMGFSGIFGDRCYAIKNAAARKGFPYLNAGTQPQMLRYHPRFRHPERAVHPPNLAEASQIAPGVNPANAEPEDLALDVQTPSGSVLAADDPALLGLLGEGLRGAPQLSLVRSDRALADCRPVSLISLPTIQQIATETNLTMDQRRFRANIYVDLASHAGFAEDAWVGHRLRLGANAEVMVLERDPRCSLLSLDPDSGASNPDVLRNVVQLHENFAGIYCAVLVEGMLAQGDTLTLVD